MFAGETFVFRIGRLLALGVVFALAGCSALNSASAGKSTSAGQTAPAPVTAPTEAQRFNDADVAFATRMIPHHQQALDMASLADSRAANPAVKALAKRIEDSQEPEIAQLSAMLEAWGQPAPEDPGMAHDASMPSTTTEQEMSALESASGADFDRKFLELMIRHHQGAVEMAGQESAAGENQRARELAAGIVQAQQAEITEMRGLR